MTTRWKGDSSPGESPLVGHLISQRYQVLSQLASSPLAEVYLARQPSLDRLVVLKVLAPQDDGPDVDSSVFNREARALSRLRHPNIVTLYDHGELEDGRLFLVLEHILGEPLDLCIARGSIRLGDTLDMAVQLISALEEAHRLGIIHRDVTPTNILVDTNEGRNAIRLIDFGIAAFTHQSPWAAPLGTPGYMAPESGRGSPIDTRSDLYSFGVVLYEMLTGETPVAGLSAIQIQKRLTTLDDPFHDAPDDLAHLLSQLIAERPTDRPTSASKTKQRLVQMKLDLGRVNTPAWGERGIPSDEALAKATEGTGKPRRATTGPIGQGRKHTTRNRRNHAFRSMPRWRFVVTLGLVSAAALGLIKLQEFAHRNTGNQEIQSRVSKPKAYRIQPEPFIHLRRRHEALLAGEFKADHWLAGQWEWATPSLPLLEAAFGPQIRGLPTGRKEIRRQLSRRKRGGSSRGTLEERSHKIGTAALAWALANAEAQSVEGQVAQQSRPDYRAAIPILRSLVAQGDRFTERADLLYYLGHALRHSGHSVSALEVWKGLVNTEPDNQVTTLARLQLAVVSMELGAYVAAAHHLRSLENHRAAKIRRTQQFLRPYLHYLRGDFEGSLDLALTFIEGASPHEEIPSEWVARMLDLVVATGSKLPDGTRTVQSYLRGRGGRGYALFYAPYLARGLMAASRWPQARDAYLDLSLWAARLAPEYRSKWLVRAASAAMMQGDLDGALATTEEELALCTEPLLERLSRLECLKNLAAARTQIGQLKAAQETYETLAKESDSSPHDEERTEAQLRLIDLRVWGQVGGSTEMDLAQGNTWAKPYLLLGKSVYPPWRAVTYARVASIYDMVAQEAETISDQDAARELAREFADRAAHEWSKVEMGLGWFLRRANHQVWTRGHGKRRVESNPD